MKKLSYAVLLLVIAMPLSAQAVRTWVSTAGVDTNPCTRTEPCRNFGAAVEAVADRGEVVAMDSGGYGAVLIFNKSVSLVAPLGIHAAIAPTSGRAIDIIGNASHQVTIRGLYLNSQGAEYGLIAGRIGVLHVERCVFSGFSQRATNIDAIEATITDTAVRNCQLGVTVFGSRMSIDRMRITGCDYGVWFHNSEGIVRNVTVAGTNGMFAFYLTSGDLLTCSMVLEDCLTTGGSFGVYASSQPATVRVNATRCTFTNADTGVATTGSTPGSNPTFIRLSDCTITRNGFGVSMGGGTVVETRQNNTFYGNFMDVSGGTLTPVSGI